MAFYDYKEDLDKHYWNPYNTATDYGIASSQIQTSTQYTSPYEFVDYKSSDPIFPSELDYSVSTYSQSDIFQFQYNPTEYHASLNYYEYPVNPSQVNIYDLPKQPLQYEPPSYNRVYSHSPTKFTMYYSKEEFNEPEFEEYDPTPYDGGYDPVKTYGKPIPPSDITCYPRSVPKFDSTFLDNFSFASIPSPYDKDEGDNLPNKSPNESKPAADTKKADCVETGDKVTSDIADVEITGDRENEFENGAEMDYGYESSEREVTRIPYGSGLEAVDICEGLFGYYWPCLAKRMHEEKNNKACQSCDREKTNMDPWRSAADYLFGSPLVYDHYENYCYHHRW